MKECSKCRSCYDDQLEVCPNDGNFLAYTISGSTTISGRYLLESRLGQGGMGIVFRAKHKFLKSAHAIKIILPSLVSSDKSLLVRFRQEAVLAASIDHPNVIRVTDFGVENDVMPFLVMEFVSGIPLSHYLLDGRSLSIADTYGLFLPIALGVAEAHRKGIVHRDLKPQNIMVQNNLPLRKAVKVLDFGLAKIGSVDSYPSLIQAKTQNVLGSPPYMSPEQWSGEGVDHRTDIYAVAVMLFQMVTGHLPFQADSMPAMMYQHLTVAPPTAASMGISLAPEIESVIQKGLAKEPDERYDSLDRMLVELGQAINKSDISAIANADTEYLIPQNKKSTEIPKAPDTVAQLSESQRERFYSYFDSRQAPELLADGQLAKEFLEAQDRIEEAKTQAVKADQLVQELAAAQQQAEEAQQKALEAKQRIEADVRRQVEAQMERLVAEEQAKREAEAQRLAEEVEARKKAEDRANNLAQMALQAQQQAESERKSREQEAQQRELHEGVRRQAEIEAQQLAAQVAEAKRQFEDARNEALREAQLRSEAEEKRRKIESDLHAAAQTEAERRKLVEAEAKHQIEEQAKKFEKEAQAARQRLDEARILAEIEAKKREQAEDARKHAEEEARRLEQEILEARRQMEEMQQHISVEHSSRGSGPQTFGSDESLTVERIPPRHMRQSGSSLQDTAGGLVRSTGGGSVSSSSEIPLYTSGRDKRSSRKMVVGSIAAGVAALLILSVAAIGGYYYFGPKKDTPIEQVEAKDRPADQKAKNAPLPRETVLIPGGSFQMGRNEIPDKMDSDWGNQYPAHKVMVEPFLIDKTETTNAQYAEFVAATHHQPPPYWTSDNPPAGQENYPVTDVTVADAKAYADWVSSRENRKCALPTEEQWEYAARNGQQQTDFPWGNDLLGGDAKLSGRAVLVGTSQDSTIVGGVQDMLGNVSEWTSSTYTLYPGHPGSITPKASLMTVRGLNWNTPASSLKHRDWLLTYRIIVTDDARNAFLGFRLVCTP
jgi:serine/threonine protein kinase/formylglycine-generating enzyme required for sulfatase activity